MKQLDRLLSLLPFNGDKTTLSLAAKLMLPPLMVKFPFLSLAGPLLGALADLGIAVGVFHKAVKASKK